MNAGDYSKPSVSDKGTPRSGEDAVADPMDLRGVRCPLNWARAKVRLETMARGAELELILDDPKGARDIPRAAEAEGYAVIEVERRPQDWRLVIRV
jgi:tRNA 2-thiouridine synthesizing protein A